MVKNKQNSSQIAAFKAEIAKLIAIYGITPSDISELNFEALSSQINEDHTEEIITSKQVADLLGYKEQSLNYKSKMISQMVANGIITPLPSPTTGKPSRKHRFSKRAILAYLAMLNSNSISA